MFSQVGKMFGIGLCGTQRLEESHLICHNFLPILKRKVHVFTHESMKRFVVVPSNEKLSIEALV